ncbi:PRD domain-containing protein [Lachnospiraceae bacterium ZAX-1]
MKISQILNNNVALVRKGDNEVVVYASGLAFKKKAGQTITNDEIEKIYVLDSNEMLEHFSYLLSQTDEKCIVLVNDIIAYSEEKLYQKANDYLSLTLLDHISFALKRAQKGQFIRNPLIWEVKRFYPKHYEIGLHALQIMNETYSVDFPEDEAASIALHFVNLQETHNNLDDAIETMEVLRDIVSIVQFHYGLEMDESSFHYMRFMTHLQYFIQRVLKHETFEDNDLTLHKQIRTSYKKTYGCVQKIKVYIAKRYQHEITIDEETYLMLHIQQITRKSERKG